jgi:hypothetical protein
MKAEKPLVNPEDLNFGSGATALVVSHCSLHREDGRHRSDLRCAYPIGKRRAEEAGRGDDNVGVAKACEGEIAQAGTHRGADEERAGEDRDGDRYASDDERVNAAIVAKRGDEQRAHDERMPASAAVQCAAVDLPDACEALRERIAVCHDQQHGLVLPM